VYCPVLSCTVLYCTVLPQVLLCEETVSLLGIRQFYALVGDSAADSHTAVDSDSSSSSSSSVTTDPQQADVSVAAAGSTSPGHSGSPQQQPAEQQRQQAEEVDPGGKAEQELSAAEQQQLLMLKVDALLQLLSSVSFHQVHPPTPCRRSDVCVPTINEAPVWAHLSMSQPAAASLCMCTHRSQQYTCVAAP
jgi:hypothetical protein